MSISRGEIIGLFGPVGSGKTSLLETLLGELPLQSGLVTVNGTISYAGQEAWIFPGSIRQNILFGQDYNSEKYNNVIKACSLVYDVQRFSFGDQTLVGAKGTLLSGGQQARINLARAIYQDADIYLLDDPLSAVDAHVGKKIFEDCITGYIQGKTCIISTHQLQFMRLMDKIVLIKEGRIEFFGTYEELSKSKTDYEDILYRPEIIDEYEAETVNCSSDESDLAIENLIDPMNVQDVKNIRKQSISSCKESTEINENFESQEEIKETDSSERKRVFWKYTTYGTSVFVVILISLFYIYSQICLTGIDFFLSAWIKAETKLQQSVQYGTEIQAAPNNTTKYNEAVVLELQKDYNLYYIVIYSGLILNGFILLLAKNLLSAMITINTSKVLHNKVLQAILHAPYVFFTENNSGRILNRFSNDMGDLDEALPNCLLDYIQITVEILGGLILACIVNTKAIILIVAALSCLYFMQKHVIIAFKNLREAEGSSRSPVFSYLNSTLQGLSTIHCTKVSSMLQKQFKQHLDLTISSRYLISEATCAFVGIIDFVMIILYLSIILVFFFFDKGDSIEAGLVISNLMRVITLAELSLKLSMDIWYRVSSFERLLDYTNIPAEEQPSTNDAQQVKQNWPTDGKIELVNVYLRYRPYQPAVIKGLNITIEAEEKIGIVGRTGSGKSSIVNALFRLAQIDGNIVIDNVDTANLRLDVLRRKISIIPQSPKLFTGSLRQNLDPFSNHADYVLNNALSEVGMLNKLVAHKGLDMIISENGNNFSIGERQLICLARAITSRNRILIMDEATANIDSKTDQQIQNVIKKKFKNCTVLTIAHRLHTVMHSHKILVMNSGVAEEYGPPYELINKPESKLRALVEETGPETARYLKQEAKQAYIKITNNSL